MTDREWIAEDDHLNREALRALMNFRVDREGALADLLNSDVPIHWFVRKALAEAFAGRPITFGSQLQFVGRNKTRSKAMAYAKRLHWLKIADWVKNRQAHGVSYEDAVLEAEKIPAFNSRVATIKKAVTYCNKIDSWIESVQISGTEYGNWSKEDLRDRYIGFDASGERMPPNRTLQQVADAQAEEMAFLTQIFPDLAPDS